MITATYDELVRKGFHPATPERTEGDLPLELRNSDYEGKDVLMKHLRADRYFARYVSQDGLNVDAIDIECNDILSRIPCLEDLASINLTS